MKNDHRPRLSLRLRVILVTIGLQVIFIAAFGGIQVYNEYRSMREFVRDSSVIFAGCIAHASGAALATGNGAMLAQSLAAAQQQHGPDIKYLVVQGPDGRVLASTLGAMGDVELSDPISQRALHSEQPIVQELLDVRSPQGLYQQCVYDIAVPIVDHGSRVATLRLGVSSSGIRERVWNVVFRGLWMAGLALAAGIVLAVAVDRKMQGSLHELIRVTRSIAAGDLSQRVAINTGDELADLGETFNEMTEQLASSRYELCRWGEDLEDKVRRRTQELEEERQKLDGIVSGIGAGLLLLDRDLRLQWANDVACAWLGPLRTSAGRACFDSLRCDSGRRRECAALRAFASGEIEQCETVSETSDGHRRFFHITASPVRDHGGEVVQVVELVQDVTEQRQMEQQLVQASKMVAMGELAAAVAHEINNPLAVISASVERMQRVLGAVAADGQLAKFPDYLDATQRHVYRCKETIDKLLGFARQKDPHVQRVDLNQVVQEAVALIAARASFEGVQVVTDLATDLPTMRTDAHGLVQVFVNLLTNALDACARSGEIRILSRREGTGVVAEVTDTGMGIAPKHLNAIFDPFFTTKPEGRGTGLGLSICRRIVDRLGGQITARSVSGAGATFTVTLPVETSPEATGV